MSCSIPITPSLAVLCLGSIQHPPCRWERRLILQVLASCLHRDLWQLGPVRCQHPTGCVFGENKATGCFQDEGGSVGRWVGLGSGTPSPCSAGRRNPVSKQPALPFHRHPGKYEQLASSPLSAP